MAKQRGGPTRPPQEATRCSTGSRLELEIAIWKLKVAIWKLKMATWQLQMAIWTFKMAIWKLKNEHFEAQKGQNWQNAAFEPPIFENDTPQFWGKFFLWP